MRYHNKCSWMQNVYLCMWYVWGWWCLICNRQNWGGQEGTRSRLTRYDGGWTRHNGVEPECLEKRSKKDRSVYKWNEWERLWNYHLMAVDSGISFRIHSQKFCASFQERLENRIRIMEIVVNDINQERCIHEPCNELVWWRIRFV